MFVPITRIAATVEHILTKDPIKGKMFISASWKFNIHISARAKPAFWLAESKQNWLTYDWLSCDIVYVKMYLRWTCTFFEGVKLQDGCRCGTYLNICLMLYTFKHLFLRNRLTSFKILIGWRLNVSFKVNCW